MAQKKKAGAVSDVTSTTEQVSELEITEDTEVMTGSPSEDVIDSQEETNNPEQPLEKGTAPKGRGLGVGGGLSLLLLGGIAGVFAAPHLSPYVPASLKPYLEATSSEVSALHSLRSDFEQKLKDLGQRVDGVQNSMAEFSADSSEKLTERLEAIEAEMKAMEAKPVVPVIQASDGEKIDLAPLLAEMEALKVQNQEISQELETFRGESEEAVEETENQLKQVEAVEALTSLKFHITEGSPITEDIEALERAGYDVPDNLAAVEDVVSLSVLETEFGNYATEAIRASILATAAEGSGWTEQIEAELRAQFISRSMTPQTGQTPDAILSRAEEYIRQDRLHNALAEISTLPREALEVMEPWVKKAEERLAVMGSISQIESALARQ